MSQNVFLKYVKKMFLSHHTFMFLFQKFQLQGEVPWTDTLQVGANPNQSYFSFGDFI